MKVHKTPSYMLPKKPKKKQSRENTLLTAALRNDPYFILQSPEKYVLDTIWSKLKWVIRGWQPTPTSQEIYEVLWEDEEILYNSFLKTLIPYLLKWRLNWP